MHVRQGWSGETKPNQWSKFDVELDEQDLRRLFMDAGVDDVSFFCDRVPTVLAYRLLEIEAERLIVRKLCTRFEFDGAAGAQEINRLNEEFLVVLAKTTAAVDADRSPAEAGTGLSRAA